MVIPRTHCHFTMQARALRVPELCDDHTPPSCLGYGLAHCSRPPETSLSLWNTYCHILLSTHSQCRGQKNVMHPLSDFSDFMGI